MYSISDTILTKQEQHPDISLAEIVNSLDLDGSSHSIPLSRRIVETFALASSILETVNTYEALDHNATPGRGIAISVREKDRIFNLIGKALSPNSMELVATEHNSHVSQYVKPITDALRGRYHNKLFNYADRDREVQGKYGILVSHFKSTCGYKQREANPFRYELHQYRDYLYTGEQQDRALMQELGGDLSPMKLNHWLYGSLLPSAEELHQFQYLKTPIGANLVKGVADTLHMRNEHVQAQAFDALHAQIIESPEYQNSLTDMKVAQVDPSPVKTPVAGNGMVTPPPKLVELVLKKEQMPDASSTNPILQTLRKTMEDLGIHGSPQMRCLAIIEPSFKDPKSISIAFVDIKSPTTIAHCITLDVGAKDRETILTAFRNIKDATGIGNIPEEHEEKIESGIASYPAENLITPKVSEHVTPLPSEKTIAINNQLPSRVLLLGGICDGLAKTQTEKRLHTKLWAVQKALIEKLYECGYPVQGDIPQLFEIEGRKFKIGEEIGLSVNILGKPEMWIASKMLEPLLISAGQLTISTRQSDFAGSGSL